MTRGTPWLSERLLRIPPANQEALRGSLRRQKRYLLPSRADSRVRSCHPCCCPAVQLLQFAWQSSPTKGERLRSEAKQQNVPLRFSLSDDASPAFQNGSAP